MEVKVIFFKETGKYYTEENINVPAEVKQVYEIIDWLKENVKDYKGMHLVAMLDEYEHGYPIMIPAGNRR